MTRRYVVLDVFTDTPLAGNPLAVVLDTDGLDGVRMQAIAAEFNLSETVFVLPPTKPGHSAAVRIFTPRSELAFAGHPTIGAAVLIAREKLGPGPAERDAVVVLEEGIGPVRCGVMLRDGVGHAVMDIPKLPTEHHAPPPSPLLAEALGLPEQDIGFDHHLPSAYTAGIPFLFVPLASLDALARSAARGSAFTAATAAANVDAMFCYARQSTVIGRHYRARMYSPEQGIPEDPATGSAVAAMAAVIERFEALEAGSHRFVFEQGIELGRPSLISLELDREPERVAAVRIAGDAVIVAEGTLRI